MEFEIHNNYTIEDFAAYWRGFRWKAPGRKPPKQASRRAMKMAAWLLLLAGGMMLGIGLWVWEESGPVSACMGLMFFGAGIFAVLRRVPEHPYFVRKAWSNYQKQGENYMYRFTEMGIEIHTKNSDHRYDYVYVQQLWEDEGHFYIFMGQTTPHILNKIDFTQGKPEEFAAFLAEKTAKPIKWVNGERPEK